MKKKAIILLLIFFSLALFGQEIKISPNEQNAVVINTMGNSIKNYSIFVNGKFYDKYYYGNGAPLFIDLDKLPKTKILIIITLENKKKLKYIVWQ